MYSTGVKLYLSIIRIKIARIPMHLRQMSIYITVLPAIGAGRDLNKQQSTI
jgi:hypothetical protein|tara:strand:- start:2501 stop:2653 length:153 start_codon:yes stop_codon:yes gene_type:complete